MGGRQAGTEGAGREGAGCEETREANMQEEQA